MFEYIVMCAWCQSIMDTKQTDDPKMQDEISHSICQSCKSIMEG